MKKWIVLMSMFSLLAPLEGCKWQDDFRERAQPQLWVLPERPTLNPDSVDYVGNPIKEEEIIEKDTPLPEIDAVSPIPDVPEYPGGVCLD